MHFTACGMTDIGQARKRNEDAFLIDEQLGLFVVCDGMGGHAAGEVAAERTTQLVAEYIGRHEHLLREVDATPTGYYKVVELAELATVETCRALHEMASSDPEYAGMGTTMTLLIMVGDKAVMSHVGDSRLYLLRDDQLHLLSSDHTLANEMLQRGVLSAADFESSPYQHVLTRAIGSVAAVEADLLLFDVMPGDTFLLCSDGLSKHVDDFEEITSYLKKDDLQTIPDQLVQLANSRGGRDNVTAIAVRVDRGVKRNRVTESTRLKTTSLAHLFLSSSLTYSRLIRLVGICELREVASDATIVEQGAVCDGMFVVVEGTVSVESAAGEPLKLLAGDVFAETALVRKRKAQATVKAAGPAQILLVPRRQLQRLSQRFPRIGRAIHARLLEHFAKQLDHVGQPV